MKKIMLPLIVSLLLVSCGKANEINVQNIDNSIKGDTQSGSIGSLNKAKNSIPEIAIGKPCDLNNINTIDTHGLQCYFYDSKDAKGNDVLPRLGIWIKPNINDIHPSIEQYNNSIYSHGDWKKYESPDKKFSFSYPVSWKINDLNWKDRQTIVVMTDPNDASITINIEEVQTNSITVQDRIRDIKKSSSSSIEDKVTLNNAEATLLITAPVTNLYDEGKINLFFEQPQGYIFITAPQFFRNPLIDAAIEDLLNTLKVL